MNIVIYLNGNADTVAFADTEATGKNYVILDMILGNRALKELDYLLRAFKVTGGAYTNLNEQHYLYPRKNFLCEEFINAFGGYGMEGVVNGYTYALLALAHAEGSAEIYLVAYVVFCDEVLELFNYLTGSLDVAGASDTYCNFDHDNFTSQYI